jgi:predicted MPP superfamily phosphohydrolase
MITVKLMTRRGFLRLSVGAIGAAAVAGLVDAVCVEPQWVEVNHPVVPIAGLGQAWVGAKIALWADIHSGHLIDMNYLRRLVELTNRQHPDIVALSGDIVLRMEGEDSELVRVLGTLRAPAGIFAAQGNHDNVPALRDVMRRIGGETLINEHRILVRDGQKLCIAGVADLWSGRPDLAQTLRGEDPNVPCVLLCHNPDFVDCLTPEYRVDLMLCGHTHGGQICLPLIGPLSTAIRHREYFHGQHETPYGVVYTTRGLGMAIVKARFRCRPELPVITLCKA